MNIPACPAIGRADVQLKPISNIHQHLVTAGALFAAGVIAAVSLVALAGPSRAAEDNDQPRISGPHIKDNLAVYFVHGKSKEGPVPLTLAEALRKGRVIVHETGRVEQLQIENTGTEEVFVQAGDIVKGGRQDRVLTISLLIPPKSGKIAIGSYCVEQGRWSKRKGESVLRFSSADTAMPSKAAKIAMLSAKPLGGQQLQSAMMQRRLPASGILREQMRLPQAGTSLSGPLPSEASNRDRFLRRLEQRRRAQVLRSMTETRRQASRQQEVWRNVADIQRKLSANLAAPVRSRVSASSLQLSLEHKKLAKARREMAAALLPLAGKHKDVIGFAFAINGRINSAEIYPSNGLFAKMWPKLLKASVTEAIAEKSASGRKRKVPGTKAVKLFLAEGGKGKPEQTRLNVSELRRERRETDKALSLATRRADGTFVHQSLLAR